MHNDVSHILNKILPSYSKHLIGEICNVCLFFFFFMFFLVLCSLTKDMTGKEDVYRGPAIRALCRITDVSVLQLLLSRCLIHTIQ